MLAQQHRRSAMQDPVETTTLNQLAGIAHICVSSDTPARSHIVCQSLSDINSGSCEIQSQTAKSFIDNSRCCYKTSLEPKQSQTAAPLVSGNKALDCDADGPEHSIELQEQGHAEMLEHALGNEPLTHCLSFRL